MYVQKLCGPGNVEEGESHICFLRLVHFADRLHDRPQCHWAWAQFGQDQISEDVYNPCGRVSVEASQSS